MKTRGYHWQAHTAQPVIPESLTKEVLAVALGEILLDVLRYGSNSNIFELALKHEGILYPSNTTHDVKEKLATSILKDDYSYMKDPAHSDITPMPMLTPREWGDIISFDPVSRARAIENFNGSEGAYLNFKNIVMNYAEKFGMSDQKYTTSLTRDVEAAEDYSTAVIPHRLSNHVLRFLYDLDDMEDESYARKLNEYQNILDEPETDQKQVRPLSNLSILVIEFELEPSIFFTNYSSTWLQFAAENFLSFSPAFWIASPTVTFAPDIYRLVAFGWC